MAILSESRLWPIHSARRLHDQAQQGFLWQFSLTDVFPRLDEDTSMLAQTCTMPGEKFDQKSYFVAGQEQYYLGDSHLGGSVSARFLETEGGKVDRFFRTWAATTDVPTPGIGRVNRWRRPKGFGDGVTGSSRSAIVRLITRGGRVGVEFWLTQLQLLEFGPYELSYESTGPLILSVTMLCDEVIRRP